MNDEALQKRNQIAANYLQEMQDLAFEITVARQEMLCSSLASMASNKSEGFRSSEKPLHFSIDAGIELKIRAAGGAIRALNLQYAALLKHSGKTIALLSSLCRTHTGQFQEARGPRLKHQTWSCEM